MTKELQHSFPPVGPDDHLPKEVSPHQFYQVFKDTLTSKQRAALEEYIRSTPTPVVAADTANPVVFDEAPQQVDEVTREQWHDEYDVFMSELDGKELPPSSDRMYTFEQRTNHDKVWEFADESIKEYMMYNYDVGLHTLEFARDQCRDTWGGDKPIPQRVHALNVQVDADISYFKCSEGVVVDMDVADRWAYVIDPVTLREYPTFQKSGRVMISNATLEYVFACASLKVFNNFAIAKRAKKLVNTQYKPTAAAELVDGVPGCGKTYRILQEFTIRDVIITTVRETRDATLEELLANAKFAGLKDVLENRVRTVDSGNIHSLPRAETLFVDEGLMAHSGAKTMAVKDTRAKRVKVFGDSTQIRFIDRGSRIGNMHFQSLFYWTQITEVNESVRCPADAMWVSSQFYPEERRSRIKTFSPIRRSITYVYEPNGKSSVWEDVNDPWVVISILRADGGDIVSRNSDKFVYGAGRGKGQKKKEGTVKVFSVHEIQGRTKPVVRAIRISPFNPDVVNSPEHINVCFTRHTLRMVYVSTKDATNDKCASLALKAQLLTDEELDSMVLPTPEWLQKRMLQQQEKYVTLLQS
jgi:hypothetical protein